MERENVEFRQRGYQNRGIKFFFSNCGNGIAENGKKKKKKKVVLKSMEESKKKKCCPQYFHSKSHVISYY